MKNTTIRNAVLFLAVMILLNSCSNIWISTPFTAPEKIVKVERGMTVEQVSNILGIPPYDVLHLKAAGSSLLSYKYRRQFRNVALLSESSMHNEASQTAGKIWYKDPASLHVYFKEGKLVSMITDAGLQDSDVLLIDEDMIQAISKSDLDFYRLSKNEGITDSTYLYNLEKVKRIGKVSLIKLVLRKKIITTTEEVGFEVPTTTVRRSKTLPIYSKPTVSKRYMNYLTPFTGIFNTFNTTLNYERIFVRKNKFVFGAGIGVGVSIALGRVSLSAPIYLMSGLYLDKQLKSSIELNIGAAISSIGFHQVIPIAVGYKYEWKKSYVKSMVGMGVILGSPHFSGTVCWGVRF